MIELYFRMGLFLIFSICGGSFGSGVSPMTSFASGVILPEGNKCRNLYSFIHFMLGGRGGLAWLKSVQPPL